MLHDGSSKLLHDGLIWDGHVVAYNICTVISLGTLSRSHKVPSVSLGPMLQSTSTPLGGKTRRRPPTASPRKTTSAPAATAPTLWLGISARRSKRWGCIKKKYIYNIDLVLVHSIANTNAIFKLLFRIFRIMQTMQTLKTPVTITCPVRMSLGPKQLETP